MEYFFYFFFFITLYFQIFLLWSFFEKREESNLPQERELQKDDFLTTTIIVPCFNEESTVERTVLSLLNLSYPKDKLSIMIVDDGSTDSTWDVLQQFKDDPRIILLQKENEGSKYAALNFALKHIHTELVGVLDADSWVDPRALREYMYQFRDPEVMAVIPSMRIADPDNPLRKAQKAEYDIGIFARKVFSHINAIYITPGPFSVFRKYVFDTLGPYREAHHTEDAEIALRMQKYGYKIAYNHRAVVYTVGPKTIPSLIKQRIRWTYGFIKNLLDYKELLFNKKYGELSFVVLPIGIFRIFIAVFLLPISLWLFITPFVHTWEYWSTTGFSLDRVLKVPHLDPFFLYLSPATLLGIIGVLFTFLTLYLGRKVLGERKISFFDFVYLITMYTLISPIWLTKSVLNALRSKKEAWR